MKPMKITPYMSISQISLYIKFIKVFSTFYIKVHRSTDSRSRDPYAKMHHKSSKIGLQLAPKVYFMHTYVLRQDSRFRSNF